MTRYRKTLLGAICAICTLVSILLYLGATSGPIGSLQLDPMDWGIFVLFKKMEYQLQDWQIREGRSSKRNPDLVYLAVDEASITLSALGDDEIAASPTLKLMHEGFPYNRAVYGHILDKLFAAGARFVVFDFLFIKPDEVGDPVFRAALEKYQDKVLIGCNVLDETRDGYKNHLMIQMPNRNLVPSNDTTDPKVAFVHFSQDIDGVVRRTRFHFTNPPDTKRYEILSARTVEKLGLGALVPADDDTHLIRWVGPSGEFKVYSLYEIFVPSIWQHNYGNGSFFKDKIVLVGPEGNFLKDELQTPYGTMPGPEIHLNMMNAILNQEYIADAQPNVSLATMVVVGLLAWGLALRIKSPIGMTLIFVGLSTAYFEFGQYVFDHRDRFFLLFYPIFAFDASGVGCMVAGFVAERIERRRVRSTLERYVSKNLVKELLDNPASYFNKLGGVRLPVTVLFSDVRDFTKMTEKIDPTEMVLQLNEYLQEMTSCVFANEGTLDKFIGDAVMAVWGNIKTQSPAHDALAAVKTVMMMKERLLVLNERWQKEGKLPWSIGLGINQGDAIAGNIGSVETKDTSGKMDLTVIGDAVNLASRLESLTKKYRLDFLMGETVATHVKDHYHLQMVDYVLAKGKSKAVAIYTVLGEKSTALSPDIENYLRTFENGVMLYRKRSFPEAHQAFLDAMKCKKGDYLANMYMARCDFFRNNPPHPDWDGVYVHTEK